MIEFHSLFKTMLYQFKWKIEIFLLDGIYEKSNRLFQMIYDYSRVKVFISAKKYLISANLEQIRSILAVRDSK